MTIPLRRSGITRRALLAQAAGLATLAVGATYICAPDAAWALEVTAIKPETMATLIQMARDIYPHDKVADNFYAVAVKGYDTDADAAEVEAGIAALNAASVTMAPESANSRVAISAGRSARTNMPISSAPAPVSN